MSTSGWLLMFLHDISCKMHSMSIVFAWVFLYKKHWMNVDFLYITLHVKNSMHETIWWMLMLSFSPWDLMYKTTCMRTLDECWCFNMGSHVKNIGWMLMFWHERSCEKMNVDVGLHEISCEKQHAWEPWMNVDVFYLRYHLRHS